MKKAIISLICLVFSFIHASYAQPSLTPGCFLSGQGRVYLTPTNVGQTTYSPTGNLLDWVTNGSVCISPNEYAIRTGISLGSCTVTGQGSGTKWLYTKIACPLDDTLPFFAFGILGVLFLSRRFWCV